MKELLIPAVLVAAGLSFLPNILEKKNLSDLGDLLIKRDFEAFDAKVNSKYIKAFTPIFNREVLILNSYIMRNDNKKIEETFERIFKLRLSTKQQEHIYLLAFNYYVEKNNREKIDEIHNKIQGLKNEEFKKNNQMIYDICILKKANYLEDMLKEYETNKNKDLEALIYLQYKNINDEENAKIFKERIDKH